jgi:hypothetical protein
MFHYQKQRRDERILLGHLSGAIVPMFGLSVYF